MGLGLTATALHLTVLTQLRQPGDRLFVTAGIGTSKFPLRNVVPEVPVLVLRPA